MAAGNQTFQKRQRENKLREKAQQKRDRREQRKIEKKQLLAFGVQPPAHLEPENPIETTASTPDRFGGDQ